jgi:hypothetical protein
MYFDWITSDDGPWKSFLNRKLTHTDKDDYLVNDLEFIWKNGWVWSDLSSPANLQHNFLVAARMSSEWPKLINLWYDRVKKYNLNKALTFVFLDIFKCDIEYDASRWLINHKNKYDWPVDVCSASDEYVKNFCSGRVEALTQPYKSNPSYKPVNRIFGNNEIELLTNGTYPTTVFNLYSSTFGYTDAQASQYFDKHTRKRQSQIYKYVTGWSVTEDEVIKIIKLEEKRLGL